MCLAQGHNAVMPVRLQPPLGIKMFIELKATETYASGTAKDCGLPSGQSIVYGLPSDYSALSLGYYFAFSSWPDR